MFCYGAGHLKCSTSTKLWVQMQHVLTGKRCASATLAKVESLEASGPFLQRGFKLLDNSCDTWWRNGYCKRFELCVSKRLVERWLCWITCIWSTDICMLEGSNYCCVCFVSRVALKGRMSFEHFEQQLVKFYLIFISKKGFCSNLFKIRGWSKRLKPSLRFSLLLRG